MEAGSAKSRAPMASNARIAPAMSPVNESAPPSRAWALISSGSGAPSGRARVAARAAAISSEIIFVLASQTALRSFESTGTSRVSRSAFVGENAGRDPSRAGSWRYSVSPRSEGVVETS